MHIVWRKTRRRFALNDIFKQPASYNLKKRRERNGVF